MHVALQHAETGARTDLYVDETAGDLRTRTEYRPATGAGTLGGQYLRLFDGVRRAMFAVDVFPESQSHVCKVLPVSNEEESAQQRNSDFPFVRTFRWEMDDAVSNAMELSSETVRAATDNDVEASGGDETEKADATKPRSAHLLSLVPGEETKDTLQAAVGGWRLLLQPGTRRISAFLLPGGYDGALQRWDVVALRPLAPGEADQLFMPEKVYACVATVREVAAFDSSSLLLQGSPGGSAARLSVWSSADGGLPPPPWPELCRTLPRHRATDYAYGNWGGTRERDGTSLACPTSVVCDDGGLDWCFFQRASVERTQPVRNPFDPTTFLQRPCLAEGVDGFQGCVRAAAKECKGDEAAPWRLPGDANGRDSCRAVAAAALCMPSLYARPCTTAEKVAGGLIRWSSDGRPVALSRATYAWVEVKGGPCAGATYACCLEDGTEPCREEVTACYRRSVQDAAAFATEENGRLLPTRSLAWWGTRVGDGWCDNDLNLPELQHDGGDCCMDTCVANPRRPHECGGGRGSAPFYHCLLH